MAKRKGIFQAIKSLLPAVFPIGIFETTPEILEDGEGKPLRQRNDGSLASAGVFQDINDGKYKDITIQNPVPTDGDSLYCKDIDVANSDLTGWSGDVCDLVNGFDTLVSNTSGDNPKTIIIKFLRTIWLSAITLSSSAGNEFSNVNIYYILSEDIETLVINRSSQDDRKTSEFFQFNEIVPCIGIKLEFHTIQPIGITELNIQKQTLVRVDPNNEADPLHIINTDHTRRIALNSIFGDAIQGVRKSSYAIQYQYGIEENTTTEATVGSGTVYVDESMLHVSTGTDIDGKATIQTRQTLRYIPGQEAYACFTAVFSRALDDSYQRIGLFDDINGFFIGYEGTEFGISKRRGAIDDRIYVDPSTAVLLDASFDPTKGNVYRISFGYLGFAPITFEVIDPNGVWRPIGRFLYPNTQIVTHILNTNLPLRLEVENDGNNTDIILKTGSITMGMIDGGGMDPSSRLFSHSESLLIAAGGDIVFALRNKTTFFSKTNGIQTLFCLLSIASDGNKTVSFTILKNPTVTNTPTWQDIDTNNSTIEYSTDILINLATGKEELTVDIAKIDSRFEDIENQDIRIFPGDYIVIVATSSSTSEVTTSIRWKELF